MGDEMQVYLLEVSLHGEFLRQLKGQTPVGRLQEGQECPFTMGGVGGTAGGAGGLLDAARP